ncbi:NF038396 family protein [Galactobacter caseinivorans]|uniref:Uncharacterized protein n=1 Tax=Galactobacter caseinivorans TaxID=2676123 RepID=A0A496PLN3_9MICC|nr:NF038396 family protein [Galactobacter caseinivorans]RKW71441.1 hypothetical protein DWQ67_00900 [Galactobacter caseinivorans]
MKDLTRRPETLFVLGYMLFPLLALVVAVAGVWSVVIDRTVLGVILIVVVAQIFVFGALWCANRRTKLLAEAHGAIEASMTDEQAINAYNAREALEIEAKEKEAREKASREREARRDSGS